MRIMKFYGIVIIILLPCTCTIPNDSYDSKLKEIFFNANTNAKYSTLVEYFQSIKSLEKVEFQGWTSYPPLSALNEADNETISTLFEFHEHPIISKGLATGSLSVSRIGTNEDTALAALDIYFNFKLKADAENLYNAIAEDFRNFKTSDDDTLSQNIRSIQFSKAAGTTGILMNLFHYDMDSLYSVTLTVIGKEP